MPPIVEFSTITEMFDRITSRFLDYQRPMLMYKVEGKYQGISFPEMKTLVENFSLGLAALGVKRGDKVALISENRPEWVISDMSMMKLGAVNVSVYPTLTPKQIEFILNDAVVKFVIVSNQFNLRKLIKIFNDVPTLKIIVIISEKGMSEDPRVISYSSVMKMGKEFDRINPGYLEQEMKKNHPEDLITLIYTSGTTGNPKGVMLSHKNLVSNIKAATACIPFIPEDTILSFLPLCHSYERMAGYYSAMSCGATIAYAESIDTVRENLIEVQPTVVTTVPRLFERFYNRIMKQISEETTLKQGIFNWAIGVGKTYMCARKNKVVSPSLSIQYKIADKLVFQKIRARTGRRIKFFISGGAALAPELGEFFEAVRIMILEGYGMTESSPVISVNRPDNYKFGTVGIPIPGVEVRISDDGEILVKGPNVMKGYWNNKQATNEVIDSDGWLHTGDIGLFDADGFLKITDRKKHLFVSSGGKNIAPQHIENLFLQSNYIDQFVLIGDGRMFLTALIVPQFDELKEFASQREITYKNIEDLTQNPEINKLLQGEMNRIQKDLANYERVRKFTILTQPLTIENDELTPTLKIKRKVVEEKFKNLIEEMYHGVN